MAGANEKVRLGFIGLGNRGDQVLDAFLVQPDCQVVAVCDLWQPYLDFAASKIGTSPKQYNDYRQLLDRKDVDAVVIATPDHWHALQTIHACQAGKDVYVEKPLSLRVAEGRAHGRGGPQRQARHAGRPASPRVPFCKEAAELVRSGGIGKVTDGPGLSHPERMALRHRQPGRRQAAGRASTGTPGSGPAPMVAYNKNRTFYRFRWFFDYSGGQLTNFGVHYLDMIHWALGRARAAGGGRHGRQVRRHATTARCPTRWK